MKNIIRILIITTLISLLWILPSYAQDNMPQTTASLSVKENMVTVKGNTNTNGYTEVSLYVMNPNNQPTYANQVVSAFDGSFSFDFPMEYNIVDGTYKAYIGRGDTDEKKIIWFNYSNYENSDEVVDPNESAEVIYNRMMLDSNITVGIYDYTPKITVWINSPLDSEITLYINNDTDDIEITRETICPFGGEFSFDYDLPSLISGKDYRITLIAETADELQITANAVIDTSLLFLDISGDVYIGDNINLDVRILSNDDNFTERNTNISDSRLFSMKIPNLIRNADFTMSLKGYKGYNEDSVNEIVKTDNPNLYYALKNLHPELDNNSDGIITQQELNSITGVLNLRNKNIEVLAGLGECKNVTGLILSDNKIKTLRPLSNMTKLEYVDAQNNEITNISTMPQSIRYLNISNNLVTGLQGLKHADNLEYLSASHNKISDISGIGDKKKLRHLNLYDNQIKDVWSLIGCERLIYADLGKNNIESTTFLSKLKNVYYINMKENK